MKQFVFFVTMLLFMPFCSSAQRLNKDGKKMVAKLELTGYDKSGEICHKIIYDYQYNNDQMQKVTKTSPLFLHTKTVLFRNGSKISRKDYNSASSEVSVSYDFDGKYIKKKYEKYSDGNLITHRYVTQDGRLNYIIEDWKYDDTVILELSEKEVFNEKYTNYRNDTNIDLNYCFYHIVYKIVIEDEVELMTEWISPHSYMLLDNLYTRFMSTFDYEFDNAGNIVKITETKHSRDNTTVNRRYVLSITYVE